MPSANPATALGSNAMSMSMARVRTKAMATAIEGSGLRAEAYGFSLCTLPADATFEKCEIQGGALAIFFFVIFC